MENKKIIKQFEELKYCSYEKNNNVYVGIKGGEGPITGTFVLNNTFYIYEKNKKIIMHYLVGQISTEKEFKTVEELIDFVKEVFPIEK